MLPQNEIWINAVKSLLKIIAEKSLENIFRKITRETNTEYLFR